MAVVNHKSVKSALVEAYAFYMIDRGVLKEEWLAERPFSSMLLAKIGRRAPLPLLSLSLVAGAHE